MLNFQNQAPKKSRKTKKVGFNSNTGYFGSPLEMLTSADLQDMFGTDAEAIDASLLMQADEEEWNRCLPDYDNDFIDEDPYW